MISFLRASASGMVAQQTNLDVIANNLANVNTAGFKGSRVSFEDLVYQQLSLTGELVSAANGDTPRSVRLGAGVRTAQVTRLFDQGDLQVSDDPFHLAIHGEGFFLVQMPDGSPAFTRDGSFQLDADRRLVTSTGAYLLPDVVIPPDAREVSIDANGIIIAHIGNAGETAQIGEIQLARFSNPAGLLSLGGNLFAATASSGPAVMGYPGEGALGLIRSRALERSNVNVANEMTNLILAQRAYQLNARTLQTIDDMLGMANNLRR